jgi:DNA-directed RNA polymerase specialized sigma24 family protein
MTQAPTTKKASNHYVDNQAFLAAIKEHREKVEQALEQGKEAPRVSNYIGECLLKIATHLSYKSNFINYSYREEMISDGVENCIQYFHNFDPNKGSNPFAYFTQITYYAFLRRILKEKGQQAVKNKLIREMPFDAFELQGHDETGDFSNSFLEYLQHASTDDYEVKKAAKKAKKKTSLEEFLDDEQ